MERELFGEDVKDGWSRFSTGDEFRGGIYSFKLVGKLVRSVDFLLAKWFVTTSDTADVICLLESASL